MPSLQVRELPEEVYRKLLEIAKKEHRSLAQQAVVILKKGLGISEDPALKRREIINQILTGEAPVDNKLFEDPAILVRKDRER